MSLLQIQKSCESQCLVLSFKGNRDAKLIKINLASRLPSYDFGTCDVIVRIFVVEVSLRRDLTPTAMSLSQLGSSTFPSGGFAYLWPLGIIVDAALLPKLAAFSVVNDIL